MHITTFADKTAMGRAAARLIADRLRAAIAGRGEAAMIMATGASQFETLGALVLLTWSRAASARTAIWRSTIRRPTLRRNAATSWLNSTRFAVRCWA